MLLATVREKSRSRPLASVAPRCFGPNSDEACSYSAFFTSSASSTVRACSPSSASCGFALAILVSAYALASVADAFSFASSSSSSSGEVAASSIGEVTTSASSTSEEPGRHRRVQIRLRWHPDEPEEVGVAVVELLGGEAELVDQGAQAAVRLRHELGERPYSATAPSTMTATRVQSPRYCSACVTSTTARSARNPRTQLAKIWRPTAWSRALSGSSSSTISLWL